MKHRGGWASENESRVATVKTSMWEVDGVSATDATDATGRMAESIALATLSSLEYRLRRLEYYLSGSPSPEEILKPIITHGKDHTIQKRLSRLERNLDDLASRSKTSKDLLELRVWPPLGMGINVLIIIPESKHPLLFRPSAESSTTASSRELLAIINASAPSFPQTASRLSTLHDLPIPPASASIHFLALQPRLENLKHLQAEQMEEMKDLRNRSARAIERWYELGVLGEGECWVEWEGRLDGVEKMVRRREAEREKDDVEEKAYKM